VTGVDVSAASGRLTIATDGPVPADADVIAAVDEAGYSAVRA
jgi:copper chaperone CopZ